MNYNDMLGMVDGKIRKHWRHEANLFCKCGGVRAHLVSPEAAQLNGWWFCECRTPENSWAAKSYRDRFNSWIQPDNHVPAPKSDGSMRYIIVRGADREDSYIHARTLSQMTDSRAEDYRNRCVDEIIAELRETPAPRRKNFLHEMGR